MTVRLQKRFPTNNLRFSSRGDCPQFEVSDHFGFLKPGFNLFIPFYTLVTGVGVIDYLFPYHSINSYLANGILQCLFNSSPQERLAGDSHSLGCSLTKT